MLTRLREAHPVWHAVAWIAVYIVVFNVGEGVSATLGQPGSATAPLLLLLSAGLVLGLRAEGRLAHLGVRLPRRATLTPALYFLPLLVIALLQLTTGVDRRLDAPDVLLVVAVMIGVGFLEELLFRGFLYQAVAARRGVTAAVVVSGLTFGLGHILNLARGYTGVEQLVQIVVAIAVGVVLALLVALTGSILPGVAFHVVFNIVGSVSAGSGRSDLVLAAVVVAVSTAYAVYLVRQLRDHPAPTSPGPAGRPSEPSVRV
ncbi:CPBP family intramembrane glutamic endopeptidase [Ornithinimicrobium avium]|uniref:CPBP family intramembrane metalloprotease n=1 Tax=Ornithinimicrobium avium TaxID=2283195 RepID=A0A345NL33_9MICO|nr:CPBP family intramembrane glutamic endopeptidase [Ornithinimicrobium avium]AXH95741.1 CPBP family intramembrane metalloprotease [Ornithinimicrobium avium]